MHHQIGQTFHQQTPGATLDPQLVDLYRTDLGGFGPLGRC
jgi:hypothetical protein